MLDLQCAHIGDFGDREFHLSPAAITPQALDDLGRFLIGRAAALPDWLTR